MLAQVPEAQQGLTWSAIRLSAPGSETWCERALLDGGARGLSAGLVVVLLHCGREGCMPRPARAGVLTKLDIMDKGTDASAMMRNQIVPLRLGYIGMVNRSQMDINMKRSIRDAGAAEAAFFETHPEYQEVRLSLCPARTGTGCASGEVSSLHLEEAISHIVSVKSLVHQVDIMKAG